MKKQKKQFMILLILFALVAGGGFGFLKYLEIQEQKEAEELAAKTIYVTKLDAEDITEFTVWYYGEKRPFEKRDGKWIAMNKEKADIQQKIVNNFAAELAGLVAANKIENVKDLSEFGLDEPGRSVVFKVGEKNYDIRIGDYNDVSEFYYVYEASDETVVYSVEPGVLTGFFGVSDVQSLEEMNG